MFYNYNNVFKGYNDVIMYGSTKITLDEGYWNFRSIVDKLKSVGDIRLTENKHNETCIVKTGDKLQFQKFGMLLGFDQDTTLQKKTKQNTTTSPNKVNVNRGLRFITVSCDTLVDESIDTRGYRGGVTTTLPASRGVSLKWSVVRYVDVESPVPIKRGIYNELKFTIKDNNKSSHVGSVLLDVYIM